MKYHEGKPEELGILQSRSQGEWQVGHREALSKQSDTLERFPTLADKDRRNTEIGALGVETGDVTLTGCGEPGPASESDHPTRGCTECGQKPPPLPTRWPKVCKPREEFGITELETQLRRGVLGSISDHFLGSEFSVKEDRT